jgi:hypothetical protein
LRRFFSCFVIPEGDLLLLLLLPLPLLQSNQAEVKHQFLRCHPERSRRNLRLPLYLLLPLFFLLVIPEGDLLLSLSFHTNKRSEASKSPRFFEFEQPF